MTTMTISQRVDARGLSCPMPIVKVAQAMKQLGAGETLKMLATDPGSVRDVEAWARTTGHQLLESTLDGGIYRFVLRHK